MADLWIYIVAFVIVTPVATCVLTASIWVMSDNRQNIVRDQGWKAVMLKCLMLVSVVNVLGLLTQGYLVFGVLILVIYFGGLKYLFGVSLGKAFLIAIVNWFISFFVMGLPLKWLAG